jgi:hypothetical protein
MDGPRSTRNLTSGSTYSVKSLDQRRQAAKDAGQDPSKVFHETLSEIGERALRAQELPVNETTIEAAWQAIYKKNKGVIGGDPNVILPDQKLDIPDLAGTLAKLHQSGEYRNKNFQVRNGRLVEKEPEEETPPPGDTDSPNGPGGGDTVSGSDNSSPTGDDSSGVDDKKVRSIVAKADTDPEGAIGELHTSLYPLDASERREFLDAIEAEKEGTLKHIGDELGEKLFNGEPDEDVVNSLSYVAKFVGPERFAPIAEGIASEMPTDTRSDNKLFDVLNEQMNDGNGGELTLALAHALTARSDDFDTDVVDDGLLNNLKDNLNEAKDAYRDDPSSTNANRVVKLLQAAGAAIELDGKFEDKEHSDTVDNNDNLKDAALDFFNLVPELNETDTGKSALRQAMLEALETEALLKDGDDSYPSFISAFSTAATEQTELTESELAQAIATAASTEITSLASRGDWEGVELLVTALEKETVAELFDDRDDLSYALNTIKDALADGEQGKENKKISELIASQITELSDAAGDDKGHTPQVVVSRGGYVAPRR